MAEDLIQIYNPNLIIRNIICHPKKVFKLDTGQRKLTALFKAPVTVLVSADTVKTNQDSDITNTYPLMDHTFYTMAHTNLKWPIDLCQHGAIGPSTSFLPNHCMMPYTIF